MFQRLIYIFMVIVYVAAVKNDEYKGYKVYTINLTTSQQRDNFDLLRSDVVDFWSFPNLELKRAGRAMVPPSHQAWFEETLKELDIPVQVFVEDVYDYLLDKENLQTPIENQAISSRNALGRTYDLTQYLRYNDILEYALSLEDEYLTSTNISVEAVGAGLTFQNRELFYLKITSRESTSGPKPIIVLEAAAIPREWITVSSAMHIVDKLLEDEQYSLLEEFEWIVIPVLNPDGYEFTHTSTRLWSKSRRTNVLPLVCVGVNVNRNYDMDFGNFDSSSNPCSDSYSGGSAFSEPESQVIQNLVEIYGDRIKLYISLQNKGGIITYPWSYERAASGLFKQHHLLALSMASVMTGNNTYIAGVSSVAIDRASGTSSDYVRTKGVRYTYNLDIAQVDASVVIPVENIPTIVDDVWRAVAVAARGIEY